MKLIFYSPQFYPSIGGLQNVVKDWALALHQAGWQVTVICSTSSSEPEPFPFTVLRNAPFWVQVKEMRSSNYVLMFNVSLKALPQVILSGRPLIINHQTSLYETGRKEPLRQWLKKMVAYRLAVLNVACSKNIAATYRHSAVISNPYNNALFINQHQRRSGHFLFVGRLVTDKGVDILLDAFRQVLQQTQQPYNLTIVGLGPELERLQQQAAAAGISDRVHFSGALLGENLVDAINRHQIMIVPSRVEPFGIVVLEGLACGCRVIASNAGGLPEAAGGFARLFAAGDSRQLATAMQQEMEASDAPSPTLAPYLEQHSVAATARQLMALVTGIPTKTKVNNHVGHQ